MPVYKLAGRVVRLEPMFADSLLDMAPYLYNGPEEPETVFQVTPDEFNREKERWIRDYSAEIDGYILSKMLYGWIIDHNATYLHSCAIEMDGWAYAFTAPSGTGKSTHSRLWIQRFGDRVTVLNDDKAFIRVADDGHVYACGSPWHGKIAENKNAEARLAGICILRQDKVNTIERIPPDKAASLLLTQIFLPDSEDSLNRELALLDRIVKNVPVYRLGCTISEEAAELAYKTMCPEEKK